MENSSDNRNNPDPSQDQQAVNSQLEQSQPNLEQSHLEQSKPNAEQSQPNLEQSPTNAGQSHTGINSLSEQSHLEQSKPNAEQLQPNLEQSPTNAEQSHTGIHSLSEQSHSKVPISRPEHSKSVNLPADGPQVVNPRVIRCYTRINSLINSEHSQKETVNSKLGSKYSKKVITGKRKARKKRNKTGQKADIDLDNEFNEDDTSLINMESMNQLLEHDKNVGNQMELLKFVNQNEDFNGKFNKIRSNKENKGNKTLSVPIEIKQTDQQMDYEKRQLFDFANQLIELSNRLVEPKAMNKLPAEDKSDICNGTGRIAGKLFEKSQDSDESNSSSSDEPENMETEEAEQIRETQKLRKRVVSPAHSLNSINEEPHPNKRVRMENLEIGNTFKNCFEQTEINERYDERIQEKLRRTRIVNVNDPKDYTNLRDKIEKNEEFLNGKVNIREFTCSANGKISIECDKPKGVPILGKILDSFGHKHKPATSSKFLFRIPGIPAELNNENFINQISRRDKRFKDETLFCIVDRFKLDNCRDTIVLQVLNPLKKQLKENRHIFIGFKRYKISKHYKLVQCFKCSDFGHNADFCDKETACPNCGEKHNLRDCPRNFIPNCTNCIKNNSTHINHSSWSVVCPYREQYIQWLKERADNGW